MKIKEYNRVVCQQTVKTRPLDTHFTAVCKDTATFPTYHMIFKYPYQRIKIEKDKTFLRNYLNSLENIYKSKKRKLISSFFFPISSYNLRKDRNRKFLFYSTRLFSDILKNKYIKNNSFLVSGIKDSVSLITRGIPFYIHHEILSELYSVYLKDPLLTSKDASKLIKKTTKILELISPDFLFLWNDSLFFERFLIFCAREVGIKSICLQHGLFSDKMDLSIIDGNFADYMLLWGNSQAKIYKNNDYNMKKIRIIGYPYNIPKKEIKILNKKRICILGQPFELYNPELGREKKVLFEKLIDILMHRGFEVLYKPHPGEKNSYFYPSNVKLYKKNINKALAKFDVFISLTSTALLEASIYGKIAIQLFDESFTTDHFSKLGYSYEHPLSDLHNIVDFILSLDKPYSIPEDSILINKDVSKNFLKIIETLT